MGLIIYDQGMFSHFFRIITKGSLLCILLIFLLGWHNASAFTAIEKGLSYKEIQVSQHLKLHIFRADLSYLQIKVLQKNNQPSHVKALAEEYKSLVTINASFFDSENKVLGLLISEGKLLQKARPISWWSGFLYNGKRAIIRKVQNDEKFKGEITGIQSGPRLVLNSQATSKLKSEFSAKSVVGLDSLGRVYFIASEGAIEINQLAKWLASPQKKGGLGLTFALNLDGGSSTQLYHKSDKLTVDLRGGKRVPVALALFKK